MDSCRVDVCRVSLLVGFLIGWLVSWLIGWFVYWLDSSIVGLLVCWLVGCLVGSLVGWLVTEKRSMLFGSNWYNKLPKFKFKECFTHVSLEKGKQASRLDFFALSPHSINIQPEKYFLFVFEN